MSVIDLLDNGFNRNSNRVCVLDSNRSYTHAEVRALSHKVANGLRAAGLRPGSRVAIFSPNAARAMIALVGIIRAGAVWLPVQMRNTVAENTSFLCQNNCEFIFFDSAVLDDVRAIAANLPTLQHTICLDRSLTDILSFDDWTATMPEHFPDEARGPEDPVWIKSTGGTTGKPKSVVICQRNVEALFASFHLCMALPEPHINLAAAPITHGAGNIALCILFGGGTVVLLERAEPTAIIDAIDRHGITTVFLPPTVIYNILSLPESRQRSYPTLHYLISAGAPISADRLAEAIEVFGPVLTQAWGQTEAPFICTYLAPHELNKDRETAARLFRSCGRPSPLMRVEIMDDEGALLPPHEIGEMVVRGNLVMLGYLDLPEENAAVSRFGWHHTGDIGYRDEDGYFYIVDRKKDMVISGGFNIYPSEIEQVLWRHAAVLDCAVIGVPDEKWGEALKAVVQLKPGVAVTEAELQIYCRSHLGGLKTPKSVEIWPSLPRSEFGKVLKREIRERYWAGRERRV